MGQRALRYQKQVPALKADSVYGPKTQASVMQEFRPAFLEAVDFAENNKENYGVKSIPVSTPEEAMQIRDNSVRNALNRFMLEQPNAKYLDYQPDERFVDYFKRRWAPDNDPKDVKHLNPNWAPNVRYYLQQKYPEQYKIWQKQNLVMQQPDAAIGVA